MLHAYIFKSLLGSQISTPKPITLGSLTICSQPHRPQAKNSLSTYHASTQENLPPQSKPRDTSPITPQDDIPWLWIELYCGSAAFSRHLLSLPLGATGACILLDNRNPTDIGITDLLTMPNVHFIQFDISNISLHDLRVWTESLLHTSLLGLFAIHASHPCDTLSMASAPLGQIHRTPSGAPISITAQIHDSTLNNLLLLLKHISEANPLILITNENPWHGYFRYLPIVQHMLTSHGWHLYKSDHCAAALEDLDGPVHGPTLERQGGLWPEKATSWLIYGIPTYATLPQCALHGCRMRIPSTNLHVLHICNRTGGLQPGQRVAPKHMRSQIPQGIIHNILTLHLQHKSDFDGYDDLCYVCGDGGQLHLCEGNTCYRVFHAHCNTSPTALRCITCTLDANNS